MNTIWPRDTPSDKRNAFFEAGHAVIAWLEGLEIVQVSIEAEDDAASWIDVREPDLSQSRLRSSSKARTSAKSIIRGLLAGPASQKQYSAGACPVEFDITDPNILDQETVWRAISLAGSVDTDGPAQLRRLWKEVVRTIQRPDIWSAVEAIAAALLRDRELAGSEIEEIAQYAMGRSKIAKR
jgi:hypothetical protein